MKFYILSIGRSGTKWLADILDEADADVFHEPDPKDIRAYPEAFHSKKLAKDYAKKRKPILEEEDINIYGEVNSYLRRHAEFLDGKLLHLVRDGRDVVRSMYSRGTFSLQDAGTYGIAPDKDEWYEWSRFERLCWYWKVENEYLRKHIDKFVRFEDLISDWDAFKDMLDYLELDISKDTWESKKSRKVNKTTNHILKPYEDWSKERYEKFGKICGTEMVKYGYR